MLILLPPSEGKLPPRRGRPLDLSSLSFPELTPLRESVVETVARLSTEPDAATLLDVNPNLVDDLERNTRLLTAPTATAAHVYSGVLYQALDLESLDAASKRRANRWIVVVSALFGAVRLPDRIPAYRVNICSTLPGVGHLSREWRREVSVALETAVKPRELVVDCRSSTYAAVWRPTGEHAERWVQVTVPGASHMAKHTRGLVARQLVQAEAPRTPEALAERLSDRFEVELTPPARAGRPWQLATTARS
ncbi:peroxide stress protein YaaA [Terrabacter sp. NPDC080008]|uniref:YaaA family protein n=1 Tax=Terrabacter sp. NPDC080008 TaxID=3155176 RepID=UPI00344DBA7F